MSSQAFAVEEPHCQKSSRKVGVSPQRFRRGQVCVVDFTMRWLCAVCCVWIKSLLVCRVRVAVERVRSGGGPLRPPMRRAGRGGASALFGLARTGLARQFWAAAAACMPRRNTVKLKRPSKQLLRRRRNRLKRRRDKLSARRHKPRPENEASKRDARTPLTLDEARVQHAVETQDPAYIAAAQQLYDNIVSTDGRCLKDATNPFPQLMDGRPVKIGRDELLEMDPEMAALRIVDRESRSDRCRRPRVAGSSLNQNACFETCLSSTRAAAMTKRRT